MRTPFLEVFMPAYQPTEYRRLRQAFTQLMLRPTKIVAAFLSDRPVVNTRSGILKGPFPLPAGGQKNGWWSNGRDLLYKGNLIATRLVYCNEIHVHPYLTDMFRSCPLLAGVEVVAFPTTRDAIDIGPEISLPQYPTMPFSVAQTD